MTTVELKELTKIYDGRVAAVRDLNLELPGGRITALLGPSGCGKTTTLKMIAGLLEPTRGRVLFGERDVTQVPAEKRQAVMVFQNHLLFPYLSVGENVGFGLKMRGVAREEIERRVAAVLAQVQLDGYQQRRPAQLSGGQQQRVALARALVVEPEVLLLDEPLSNLDAHLREEMRRLILDLQRRLAITTVFVTHDQEEAVILADQIALLFNGELQQFGRPAEFYDRPRSLAVARFFGGVNFLPGRLADGRFRLAGEWAPPFQIPAAAPANAAWATIRPEHLTLCPGESAAQPNRLPAEVLDIAFRGTHTRLWLTCGPANAPLTLQLTTPGRPALSPGAAVTLALPPEKLWLLPDES